MTRQEYLATEYRAGLMGAGDKGILKKTFIPKVVSNNQTINAFDYIQVDVSSNSVDLSWDISDARVGDTVKLSSVLGEVNTNALTVSLTGGVFSYQGNTDPQLNITTDNVEITLTVVSAGIVGVNT